PPGSLRLSATASTPPSKISSLVSQPSPLAVCSPFFLPPSSYACSSFPSFPSLSRTPTTSSATFCRLTCSLTATSPILLILWPLISKLSTSASTPPIPLCILQLSLLPSPSASFSAIPGLAFSSAPPPWSLPFSGCCRVGSRRAGLCSAPSSFSSASPSSATG